MKHLQLLAFAHEATLKRKTHSKVSNLRAIFKWKMFSIRIFFGNCYANNDRIPSANAVDEHVAVFRSLPSSKDEQNGRYLILPFSKMQQKNLVPAAIRPSKVIHVSHALDSAQFTATLFAFKFNARASST